MDAADSEDRSTQAFTARRDLSVRALRVAHSKRGRNALNSEFLSALYTTHSLTRSVCPCSNTLFCNCIRSAEEAHPSEGLHQLSTHSSTRSVCPCSEYPFLHNCIRSAEKAHSSEGLHRESRLRLENAILNGCRISSLGKTNECSLRRKSKNAFPC